MIRNVLVVDSDFFFIKFLSALLEKRGYQVRKAYDGKEGIAALEEGPCDLVFAELVLPKVNGRQFFVFIRRKFTKPCFPLVALSGTVIEQMDHLEEIGADYFIAKGPIDQLSLHLNEFITDLESRPWQPPREKKILQPGGVFPRRDAMELLVSLDFHQTVIDALGRNLNDILNSQPQKKVIDSFNTAVQIGKAQFLQLEFDIENKIKKYDCTIEPIIGENGFVQILYLIFKESPLPSEEIDAMVEKLHKLDYYQEISRRTDSGIFLINSDGNILDWDKQFKNIFDLKKAEGILSIFDLFPSLERNEFPSIINHLDDTNNFEIITFLEKEDLDRIPVRLDFYRGQEVKADAIVVCTRIKLNLPILLQTKTKTEELEDAVVEISQPMCRIGLEGSIIQTNAALSSLTGYQKAEFY